jgi:hypothetical protein
LPRFFSIDLVCCHLPVTYSIDLVRHLLPDPSIWSCASCAAVAAMASCWPSPLGFPWPPPVELPWPSSLAIAEPSLRLLPLCDAAVWMLPLCRCCRCVLVAERVPSCGRPTCACVQLSLGADGCCMLQCRLLLMATCCCYLMAGNYCWSCWSLAAAATRWRHEGRRRRRRRVARSGRLAQKKYRKKTRVGQKFDF